jgi:LEA14-like dessication related protein
MRHWLGLLMTAILILTAGCSALPQSMQPGIQGIRLRIAGINLKGVDLAFDVDVNNPYPTPIRTPRFRYALDVEGAQFASNDAALEIDLPARQVGTATLPVSISYLDLWRAFGNLRNANQARYDLRGAFLFAALGREFELPVAHNGAFPILQLPEIRVVSFEPGDLSVGGASFDAAAEMTNPNIFGIGIQGLGFSLETGDVSVGGLNVSSAKKIGPGQTGRLGFTGKVSGWDAARALLAGGEPGALRIRPVGSIQTPYGAVALPGRER